jgi:cytochrome c
MSSLLGLVLVMAACAAGWAQAPVFNVGRAPTADEIKAWDISVGPAGKELPPGRGTAREGAPLYAAKCAACHGAKGEGGSAPALAGGRDTLTTIQPLKTVGSYWPFATSIWDYINRAMPRGQPQSLPPNDVYALTALLLYWNDIIQESDVMDAASLPKVKMPNRDTFVPHDLEDINRLRCRTGTCP